MAQIHSKLSRNTKIRARVFLCVWSQLQMSNDVVDLLYEISCQFAIFYRCQQRVYFKSPCWLRRCDQPESWRILPAVQSSRFVNSPRAMGGSRGWSSAVRIDLPELKSDYFISGFCRVLYRESLYWTDRVRSLFAQLPSMTSNPLDNHRTRMQALQVLCLLHVLRVLLKSD